MEYIGPPPGECGRNKRLAQPNQKHKNKMEIGKTSVTTLEIIDRVDSIYRKIGPEHPHVIREVEIKLRAEVEKLEEELWRRHRPVSYTHLRAHET